MCISKNDEMKTQQNDVMNDTTFPLISDTKNAGGVILNI